MSTQPQTQLAQVLQYLRACEEMAAAAPDGTAKLGKFAIRECIELLSARVYREHDLEEMLKQLRKGGLIPKHYHATNKKLVELIGEDDGVRNFQRWDQDKS
jgi:hypothetical protein